MLSKQIIISFSSTLIIGFTGFLTIPFLTRMLTPDEVGKIFLILALVGFMQVFDGFRPVITFVLNEKKYDESLLLKVINKINILYIVGMVVFIFFSVIFFTNVTLLEISLYVTIFIFYSLMSVLWGILDTKNHINYTSILRSLGWVLTYSMFVVFAYFHVSIEFYLVPLMLMNILLFIFFKIKVHSLPKEKRIYINQEEYISLFRSILMQIIDNVKIQISATVLLSMDKVIIPYLLGYTQFAFYAVQSELATKTYLINSTWKRVLFPYLAKIENRNKLGKFLVYAHYSFLISFIFVLTIGIYGSEIISFYAGEAYKDYGKVFSILLLVFPLNILGTMGVLILQIHGDFKLHHKIYRNSAIVNLIVFTVLTYFFGILGAAIGILISRTTDLFLYLVTLQKYVVNISITKIILTIGCYFSIVLSIIASKLFFSFLFLGILAIFLFFLNIKKKIYE